MNGQQVISGLVAAGQAVRAAGENGDGDLLENLLANVDGDTASSVIAFLDELTDDDVRRSIEMTREQQQALLAGRAPNELPPDEILALGELADMESVLVRREIMSLRSNLRWFVKDALPVLERVVEKGIGLIRDRDSA